MSQGVSYTGSERGGFGQPDRERGPASRLRPDPDLAAVVLHGVLDDRESEAGAAGVAGAGLIHPEEALEHAVEVFFRDAFALVGHRDLDDAAGVADADADAGVVGRVLDGV